MIIARFVGGPLDGQEMALPEALPTFVVARRHSLPLTALGDVDPMPRLPPPYVYNRYSSGGDCVVYVGEDSPPVPPTSTEPILAWRAWRLAHDGEQPWLTAVFTSSVWPPRQAMHACCLQRHDLHAAPDLGCGCGVWALKTRAQAEGVCLYPVVVGRVALWGRVLEGKRGYRAEYAYPYELFVPANAAGRGLDAEGIAAALRQAYACDVELGPPRDLLPHPPPRRAWPLGLMPLLMSSLVVAPVLGVFFGAAYQVGLTAGAALLLAAFTILMLHR